MARIRTIKPDFFDDEDIAALSFPARLLFIGLWLEADREGRLKDRPVRLKARIMPFDNVDVAALLDELVKAEFIERYTVGDLALIWIRTFKKHQVINAREVASGLPPAPDEDDPRVATREHPARVEGKGREWNGDSVLPLSGTTPSASPVVEVLVFPTVGSGPKSWVLTDAQVAEWQSLYPGIDVVSECRKALAWVKANQPKTASGMPKFLVKWFNNASNWGGNSRQFAATGTAGVPVRTTMSPATAARVRQAGVGR